MNCEALVRDECPCILADIGHCRCCSLLSGKQFCQCDYPGVCVYEKHRWDEKQPLTGYDQVVAVFPSDSATGIIIQWSETTSAHLGDILTLTENNHKMVQGVVLQKFTEQNLVYLLVTDKWVCFQEKKPMTIIRQHNVFGADAVHLSNVTGKNVVILADSTLLTLLGVLATSLKCQGAEVQLSPLNAKWPKADVDLFVFISQNMDDLTRALKRLPLSGNALSAFWFVS